ncbi:MAG TPA: PIN domain-containing protein [Longimicrobiaceae bacterium]|nr:PIN domain-containing protein [Longimicrobiaceae bacterium]
MIYLDTSVALAHLLSEDRRPPSALWSEELVSSRLLDYELWTRIHARGLAGTHGDSARLLLARVARLALTEEILERAAHSFPAPVRTLDALHLAAIVYLREQGQEVALATYDTHMAEAATAIGIELSGLVRV